MSIATNKPTNTVTRDPVAGLINAILFSAFLFLFVALPIFWWIGEQYFSLTKISVFELYKAFFLYTESFKKWFFMIPTLVQVDVTCRIVAALLISAASAWFIARNHINPKKTEILEAGHPVSKRTKDTLKQTKRRMKHSKGIKIHPEFRITKTRETEHLFVSGSTGAGKSQVISHMLDSITHERRDQDKSLIFCIKGDYTSQFISPNAKERKKGKRYLLAPWDKRSIQWNIAKDIQSEIDADAFAMAFIPITGKETNPYFTTAAQDVLSAILIYHIKTYGTNWGWKDLSDMLASPTEMESALQAINHAAVQHIQLSEDGAPSPQTQGVLGSIRAPMKSLDQIAKYWPEAKGVAVVNGFLNDNVKGLTLVLAARPDMQEIATPLISGLMALMMRKGLALPDSNSRRVWFILDELGALPKITKLVDLVTLGRSKGLCLIAGTQDLGRLESVYGREQVQTISSQFGTHIIGRLGDESTASWAAKLFGQQRVERLQISENQAQATTNGISYQPAASTTWQQSDKASLLDSDFLHLPKATADGFFMWARLSDDQGHAILGKVKYPINTIAKPFPACIEKQLPVPQEPKPVEISIHAEKTHQNRPESNTPSPDQTDAEKNIQSEIEEIDGLLNLPAKQQEELPLRQSEQGSDENPLLTDSVGGALEYIGLPGAEAALNAVEVLTDGSNERNTKAVNQHPITTKKKRRKRLKQSDLMGI